MGRERSLATPRLAAEVVRAAVRLLPQTGWQSFRATGPTHIEYRRTRPGAHSIASDTREIDFHYSLPAEYFTRILGSSMTYSCGIFPSASSSLEEAQATKHSLILRKLGVTSESTLLDVGCGWGGLLAHADRTTGCRAIGVTASKGQYDHLRARVASDRIRVLHGDYRQHLPAAGITCAASVGMYEHVGVEQSLRFFRLIRDTLPPGGLFLNQAIVRTKGSARFRKNGFVQRYIFPNAHVLSLSRQVRDIEKAGLSVLSVETFGAHYATTLARWSENLRANWDECARLVGEPVVRAWLMYLEGSRHRFETGVVDLAQVLVHRR
jgi:cyclopropane-fatty-acyl-phospholipid synthase